MTSDSRTSPKPAGGATRPRHRKELLQHLVSGAAIALMIVFAVLNTNNVKVDWIVVTSHTALIVVIIVSFLLGAIAGALFWRRRVN